MSEIIKDLRNLKKILENDWQENISYTWVLNLDSKQNTSGYTFGKSSKNSLTFKNIDLGRHVRPSFEEGLSDIKVMLGIDIKHYASNTSLYCIKNLGVNFFIGGSVIDKEGNGMDVLFSLHLDKDEKGDKKHEFTHPLYHLNFGGTTMTKPKEDNTPWDFGSLLLMEAPRLVHHPMDVVLAVDFILRNFYKEEKHIKITEQRAYKLLLKNATDRYLKPYYQGIMSKWDGSKTDLSPDYLLPSLSF